MCVCVRMYVCGVCVCVCECMCVCENVCVCVCVWHILYLHASSKIQKKRRFKLKSLIKSRPPYQNMLHQTPPQGLQQSDTEKDTKRHRESARARERQRERHRERESERERERESEKMPSYFFTLVILTFRKGVKCMWVGRRGRMTGDGHEV